MTDCALSNAGVRISSPRTVISKLQAKDRAVVTVVPAGGGELVPPLFLYVRQVPYRGGPVVVAHRTAPHYGDRRSGNRVRPGIRPPSPIGAVLLLLLSSKPRLPCRSVELVTPLRNSCQCPVRQEALEVACSVVGGKGTSRGKAAKETGEGERSCVKTRDQRGSAEFERARARRKGGAREPVGWARPRWRADYRGRLGTEGGEVAAAEIA